MNIDFILIGLGVFFLIGLGALYIFNIIRLIQSVQDSNYSTILILRLLGIFWAPLGVIMGFIK